MTTENVPPADPAAKRAKFVAGLHEFADWLADRPWAPITRDSGFQQRVGLQIDLHTADGIDRVRSLAVQLGVKTDESLNDRTSVTVDVGSANYCVIAWHPDGRPGEKDAELERLRAEVAELRAASASTKPGDTAAWAGEPGVAAYRTPDTGLTYSREPESTVATPVPADVEGHPEFGRSAPAEPARRRGPHCTECMQDVPGGYQGLVQHQVEAHGAWADVEIAAPVHLTFLLGDTACGILPEQIPADDGQTVHAEVVTCPACREVLAPAT